MEKYQAETNFGDIILKKQFSKMTLTNVKKLSFEIIPLNTLISAFFAEMISFL